MKRLTIFRHGKAAAHVLGGVDFDRPLTSRGEADAQRVAACLRNRIPPPDCLLSSPAIRAAQTAQIIATVFGLEEATIIWEPELYLASPKTLLATIRSAPSSSNHVMLTGHNPGLEDLARALLPEPLTHLPTAGVVSVALDVATWTALTTQPATIGEPLIVIPRELRN